ncbi:MAG: TIGR02206 family membrane protein [Flavobacteriales bacterium]|nr:TIGR02206 family membrane protein [Flavobacteriales bacterium]
MHVVIDPLSQLWWEGLISSTIGIILMILLFRKPLQAHQTLFMKTLSLILFFSWIYGHYNALFITKNWSFQYNLPLHLCRISIIIGMITLWKPKQWMYEWLLFLSIPSGIHSILTPEFTQGLSTYLIFDYYFVHAALIFIPLFLTFNRGMLPRRDAWRRSFLYVQIPFVIIFLLNFYLDSNYMYLAEKPMVNNPFLIGDWPWYIIGLELVLILHIAIIHLPFALKKCFLLEKSSNSS